MANVSNYNWGTQQLGDAGGVITWSLVGGGEDISAFFDPEDPPLSSVDPDSYLTIDYQAMIRAAFAEWSSYGDIEFMQITDDGGGAGDTAHADIRIFFGPIAGGTIGIAYYPSWWGSAIAGDMLLDTVDRFNTDPDLFYGVVLHELGHSLGLGHVDADSIMTPIISENSLQQDDIDGIRQLYGAQDGAPTEYFLPTGETILTILDAPADLTVHANDLSNRVTVGDGAQTINGQAGNDTIRTGDGNDVASGGTGADILNGETGNDLLDGGDDGDRLEGRSGHDTLIGGAGNDRMLGGGGHDLLDGEAGDDRLIGGNRNDTMLGQDGADTLVGGAGNDNGQGGDGADFLRGGSDDDMLAGGADDDRVVGGSGRDILSGNSGDDTISGLSGFDTIAGGTGNDLLTGGTNADCFVFADGHGQDTISDFEAQNDAEKIDFSGLTSISALEDLTGPGGAASQQGAHVLIDTGGGHTILLRNVLLSDLDAADFLF